MFVPCWFKESHNNSVRNRKVKTWSPRRAIGKSPPQTIVIGFVLLLFTLDFDVKRIVKSCDSRWLNCDWTLASKSLVAAAAVPGRADNHNLTMTTFEPPAQAHIYSLNKTTEKVRKLCLVLKKLNRQSIIVVKMCPLQTKQDVVAGK